MTGDPLRAELLRLLDGLDAHMPFEAAVADFPHSDINRRPPNVDYTPWHLVEHLRLTQADILDYIANPDYIGRAWPDEYWPDPRPRPRPAPPGMRAWRASLPIAPRSG